MLRVVVLAVVIGCGDPAAPITLRNPGPACDEDIFTWSLYPEPVDVGHWATSRLTVESPMQLDSISYTLEDDAAIDCDATVSHRVQVYRGDALVPPVSPEVLFEAPIALAAGTERLRIVEVPVDLAVPAGEVFVAIELVGLAPRRSCLKYCAMGVASDDHDYLSRTAAAPFEWETLFENAGRHWTFDVSAHGHLR